MTQKSVNSPRNWTVRQKAGIETVGHSLLVSAAAGSGKTAVLAERCAHLVCNAADPCGVDQLLVVTFTESAAAEMKTRIQEALRRRLVEQPSDRLKRQVALAEHAQVSTVHGFCARLLRQNFNLAGIDPEFRILDGDEAALLRREIARDLFHTRYETDSEGDFHRLIDAYGDGDDEKLIGEVVDTYGLLQSLIDPREWIAGNQALWEDAAAKPLEESTLGKMLIGQVAEAVAALGRRCDDAKRAVAALGPGLTPYVEHLKELSGYFAHWRQVLESDGLDMLLAEMHAFAEVKPRLPIVRGAVAGKELGKTLIDGVKEALDKDPLKDLLSCTSGQWQEGMSRTLPHARTFLSLVGDFEKEYLAARESQRALDFADLERKALNILRDGEGDSPGPSALARSLHEQYRHVLVDEYQDINPIQNAILSLVSRECVSAQNANLFCVGDVKQSIFRFRLAEPALFLDRHKKFSSSRDKRLGEVIDLRENFRGRAPLLQAINGIFERLMTRSAVEIEYDQSHRLEPGLKFAAAGKARAFAGAPIEFHHLPANPTASSDDDEEDGPADLDRTDYEAILLARRILEMTGRDGSEPMHVCTPDARRIEFGDIVILLRAMQHKADRFADVLRAHDIPVHSEGGSGFFEAAEVRDMVCLLQILDNQRQDIPLAVFLRSPLSGLPNADDAMARIRLAFGAEEEPIPFHEAVRLYAERKDDELAAHLKDVLARLGEWRDQANKRPVAELLWHLFEETGYLAFCGGLEDGQQRVANLLDLHRRAGQFGTFLRQGLYRFLRFLENLREQMDVSRPSPAGHADGVVRIMSIHRSKGLEFPVVCLPDLGKAFNLSDTNGSILVDRSAGLGMEVVEEERLIRYPSLAWTIVRQSLLRQTLAEELRLMYVAMTRAREHLILVGTCKPEKQQSWASQWSRFEGTMPADAVLGARCPLDWLGPVSAMGARTPIFAVQAHDGDELRTWKNPRHERPGFSEEQWKLARLEELPDAPPPDDVARGLIERFETPYCGEAFCAQPAAASVTAIAKGDAEDSAAVSAAPLGRKLDLPRFFLEESTPKATDIGNAMHTVLQNFDFSTAGDAKDIERQIQAMVAGKFLSAKDARLVDPAGIAWFLRSEVGSMLRREHGKLMREVPFALIQPGDFPSGDVLDQIMVRGRIDLLVPTDAGAVIVDYKTDNVSGEALEQRAAAYSRQTRLYARAIRTVAGGRIAGIFLVFLTPRRVVRVEAL
jgi:ATP-dependent helicase/nuclease subunit A